ncbi:family 20 glycosylhydrolase [Sulfuriroseicoccus oceanibius]|uniref:Family 20 glycosylhydrolase n=1 Tax=Sulfuriroseicoccus oceanibius TaxID=2707525 RepID=A0A6B3LF12_9BACT|nr:family 20 glycosylhydrolase [Sulfuriroseicoccus oceanibius]QQL45771.1 family 20 glycosylhydrolase [Sulfuriroseicoccus oceanibius]
MRVPKIIKSLSGASCVLATSFALSVSAAEAASVNEVAQNFDPASHLDLTGGSVGYRIGGGVDARIVGSTFEQVVGMDGKIRRPLSDVATLVTFELTKDGKDKQLVTRPLVIPGRMKAVAGANQKPAVVPALQEWVGRKGSFSVSAGSRIVIRSGDGAKGSPSLRERMDVFAADLQDVTGLALEVVEADAAKAGDIFVTLESKGDAASIGHEGYTLAVDDVLTIDSSDPLGAFWATRSVLQVLKANENQFPCGYAVDYPQYPVRGFMYDVGRKPASLEAVQSVMKTMAWYKLNDLQLHLNDNFIWLHDYTDIPNKKDATPEQKKAAIKEVMDAAPTAFRLESSIVGEDGTALTATDHFYTKQQFGALIDQGREYGVNIVPEIDVPGHAMSLVRVRPDLMYRGGLSKPHDVERAAMLDASEDVFDPATGRTYREETLDFVKQVFDEYLVGENGEEPVFRDAVVHIGTDEYYGSAEDYRAFADALLKHVKSRGFTPRLWGSLRAKPGKTPIISEGVQMHIWSLYWASPIDALNQGFDVINILDGTSYIVPNGTGNVGGYGDYLNLANLYAPSWQPHIMGNEKVIPGHPKMLGAQWALWNDNSFRRDTGLIDYDLFDRIQQSCSVMAEKTWSTGSDRSFDEFTQLVKRVGDAPATNPRYNVATKKPLALDLSAKDGQLVDGSGNGYNAVAAENVGFVDGDGGQVVELRGGRSFVKNAVENIAPNYVAEFRVKRTSDSQAPQVLFSSFTGAFYAVQKETGKVGITRDTWDYSFDYTLPVGEWVTLKLVASGRSLTLFANGEEIGAPVRHQFPESHKYNSFIFPVEYLGAEEDAFVGQVRDVKVTVEIPANMDLAIPSGDLQAKASSEHGVGADGDITKVLDGKASTYWHSKYSPKDELPFEISLKLRNPQTVDMVSFLPRQDHANGAIQGADLFARNGDGDWEKVATYSGAGTSRDRQVVSFPAREVSDLKLVITNAVQGFGTMAELNVHRAAGE